MTWGQLIFLIYQSYLNINTTLKNIKNKKYYKQYVLK